MEKEMFKQMKRILVQIVFIIILLANTAVAQTDKNPKLGLYYSFDNLVDNRKVENNFKTKLHGEVHNAKLVAGKKGKALFLDGKNSFVKLPPGNEIIGNTASKGTIEFWVKPAYDTKELSELTPLLPNFRFYYVSFIWLLSKCGNALPDGGNMISIFQMMDKNSKRIWLCATVTGTSCRIVKIISPLKKDIWTHIAITWTPDKLSLFINGNLECSNKKKLEAVPVMDDTPGFLGSYRGTLFKGAIDELKIVPEVLDINE